MEKPVTILLARSERELILRYGYPFEDIELQLKRGGETDLVSITDVPFWWERVSVNLHISETENQVSDVIAGELRALIERITLALGLRAK